MKTTAKPQFQVHTVEELFDLNKEQDDRKVVLLADLAKAKIVVEVKGGNVQAVYITPALQQIPVTLLDYDNIGDRESKFRDARTAQEASAEADIETGAVKQIF